MVEKKIKSNKSEQAKKLGFPRDNGLKKPIGSAKGDFALPTKKPSFTLEPRFVSRGSLWRVLLPQPNMREYRLIVKNI